MGSELQETNMELSYWQLWTAQQCFCGEEIYCAAHLTEAMQYAN